MFLADTFSALMVVCTSQCSSEDNLLLCAKQLITGGAIVDAHDRYVLYNTKAIDFVIIIYILIYLVSSFYAISICPVSSVLPVFLEGTLMQKTQNINCFSIVQNVQTLKTILKKFFLPIFEQEISSKTVAVLAH